MYTITDIAPTDAEFIALIAALDAWQETLYPAESNHLLDLSQLPPQTVIALAIRSPQGEAVGCGAIVLSEEGFGEMKRVYIDPQHRGQQLGEKAAGGAGSESASARLPYPAPGDRYPSACGHRPLHAQRLSDPLRVCAVSTRSAQRVYGETTVCRSSFSSAINASSWRVLAPRRHTSQVVSQRHSSASGQAETC
ncbi:N-acetyltransferase GCN5 [Klebsiella pneumoniae]|uniref:N-acetyltransferase GCN5 n=3 Tax=Enterobacteriaceae TaxID=543 RepID=A0A2X3I656_KLEPN|nr:N-acetyltransferase GCN5 [Klebsiella pneumoniae]